jgi:hypothetical protein
VFAGGENSIAVFSINPTTGEPTLIQNVDGRGIQLRTFAIDPSGRMLVAASITPLPVREGGTVKTLTAGISVMRVGGDGKLEFVRKYDVDVGSKQQFWSEGAVIRRGGRQRCVPDAVQTAGARAEWCTADPTAQTRCSIGALGGPVSAAHHDADAQRRCPNLDHHLPSRAAAHGTTPAH